MRKAVDHTLLPPDRETAREVGALYFFTGNPCRRGHISRRTTSRNTCVECIRIASEKYKNTEKGKKNQEARIARMKAEGIWNEDVRHRTLKCEYGIGLVEYEQMFQAQNGLCAICLKPEVIIDKKRNAIRRLAVDHCHATNKIRGLLCYACNTSIGKMNDDPEALERAAQYIRNKGELNCQQD